MAADRHAVPIPARCGCAARGLKRSETPVQKSDGAHILDACGDDAILVFRVRASLKAGDQAGPHPNGLGTECQRRSDGSTISDASGGDDRNGLDHINDSRQQRECRRGGSVVAASFAALHDKRLGTASASGPCFGHAANLESDMTADRP